ncbi:MAG: hypothetical protein CBCREVIR_2381, partial [Candidatus Burkholderia crenata]
HLTPPNFEMLQRPVEFANGNTGLSVTPRRPACPSRASGWSSLTTLRGFPCCVRFPYVQHASPLTPAQRLGVLPARLPSHINLPRYGSQVGLRIVLFEACSAFTRVTACKLVLSPYFVTRFTEGFNRFVTSTIAPVAFRLERLPGGAYTRWEKRRLCTAHAKR